MGKVLKEHRMFIGVLDGEKFRSSTMFEVVYPMVQEITEYRGYTPCLKMDDLGVHECVECKGECEGHTEEYKIDNDDDLREWAEIIGFDAHDTIDIVVNEEVPDRRVVKIVSEGLIPEYITTHLTDDELGQYTRKHNSAINDMEESDGEDGVPEVPYDFVDYLVGEGLAERMEYDTFNIDGRN